MEEGTLSFNNTEQSTDSNQRIEIRDRIKELRRVRARDLVHNPKNFRRHPKAQAAALEALLGEIGYADALIARELPDGRLMLIDGHLRAETTPDLSVPVLVLDVTEGEAGKILLTLDPLAMLAETDAKQIKELIESVSINNAAVEELVRSTAGEELWLAVHPEEIREVEVEPDRMNLLRAKWATEAGQLWVAGPHRLCCGDSRDQVVVDRLFAGTCCQLIWTEPPSDLVFGESSRRGGTTNAAALGAELKELFTAALQAVAQKAAPDAAIYSVVPGRFLKQFIQGLEDGGFTYQQSLLWLKQKSCGRRGDYRERHEVILYGWRQGATRFFAAEDHDSVFEADRPPTGGLHSAPVALMVPMIKNSSLPGGAVYDPFAGAGSTLVAAHQVGRAGYGCEIDPALVAVGLERLSKLGLRPELVR